MTDTQRIVMQQALEALNLGIMKMNALGCAIECMPLHYANKALREALAEPAVEPVAEVKVKMTGGNAGIATVINEMYDPLREPLKPGDKLYASPPANVPLLTDGNILWLWNEAYKDTTDKMTFQVFARAIEQTVRKKVGLK